MNEIKIKTKTHRAKLKSYYRFHSHIYDISRWSFLFGRESILDLIPPLPSRPRILEIGCGTGKNIRSLKSHYPEAQIVGVDLSQEMLSVAKNKLSNSQNTTLIQKEYGSDQLSEEPFDLILLSYSLTMVGGQLQTVLQQLTQDLNPNGYVAVVDFHSSPFKWFRHWMEMNHVTMNGQLLPQLKNYFYPTKIEVNPVYLGLWSYFLFLGKQR